MYKQISGLNKREKVKISNRKKRKTEYRVIWSLNYKKNEWKKNTMRKNGEKQGLVLRNTIKMKIAQKCFFFLIKKMI